MPDLARWGRKDSYLPSWEARAKIAGRYLKDCASVLDIGAGAQSLRKYVKGYVPADCVQFTPDTILLDLDSDFSVDSLPSCDGLALLGVLEHVANPAQVINTLSPIGKVWVVSYMDANHHKHKNLLPMKTLKACFASAGLRIDKQDEWLNQRIFRLVR